MSDSSPALLIDRSRPAIVIVAINRAHRRNAGDNDVWQGLRDTFIALAKEPVRLAILTGVEGHFCAGNDIKAFALVRHDADAELKWMDAIKASYAAIQATPFPVIAAIHGNCVGAGCGLAMSCDFRVASRDARFGIPAARLGIMYPMDQTRRLAALIGVRNARHWLYGGALHAAAAAAADGFVDALAEGDAVTAAIAFAGPFIDNAPLSVAGAKRQLNALADGTFDAQAESLAALYREAEHSADHAEAERAFAEKRPPRFTGH